MTQLQKYPDAISNYFDTLWHGIGKGGSSFTNIDGLTHDGRTERFLFCEFKEAHEALDPAQRWAYTSLAKVPRCTVWMIRKLEDGTLAFWDFGSDEQDIISEAESCERFRRWWYPGS